VGVRNVGDAKAHRFSVLGDYYNTGGNVRQVTTNS